MKLLSFVLCATIVATSAAQIRAALISNGLVLNLQADNIDGLNNATLVDGQEVTSWVDAPVGVDNLVANSATAAGGVGFGAIGGQGTPNFVGAGRPSVRFTKQTASVGDALGFLGPLGIGSGAVDFTAFVVGNFNDTGIARAIQFGDVEASATPDRKIVGLDVRNGFRFNGGSHLFTDNLVTTLPDGVHVGAYVMASTDKFGDTRFRLNGVEGVETNNPVAAGDVLNLDDEGFVLGLGLNGTGGRTDVLDGNLHAVLLYDRVLSNSEIEQVEAFLVNKFVVPEATTGVLLAVGLAMCGVMRRPRVMSRLRRTLIT